MEIRIVKKSMREEVKKKKESIVGRESWRRDEERERRGRRRKKGMGEKEKEELGRERERERE